MSLSIIQNRLDDYHAKNQQEEANVLREIMQELILNSLSQHGFFKIADFQGGTCLRIFHGLNRFSEDLDFALKTPDPDFVLRPYLNNIASDLGGYGYSIQIQDRANENNVVAGFVKDESIQKTLVLRYPSRNKPKAIKIKLEVDTVPPRGTTTEQKYLGFPVTVPVILYDLPSLFSGKCHALLCRRFSKGRDWYDFVWYVGRKTRLNINLFKNAIHQMGPWKGMEMEVTTDWLIDQFAKKVKETDWEQQKRDVTRFLKPQDFATTDLWNCDFFLDRVERLAQTLL